MDYTTLKWQNQAIPEMVHKINRLNVCCPFMGMLTIVTIMLLNLSDACGQNHINVEGSSLVRMEDNKTKEQVREQAKDLAILNAIENNFGTVVEQSGETTVRNGQVNYNISGNTKVLGEWLKTKEVDYKEIIKDEAQNKKSLWISCKVKGIARKISNRIAYETFASNCPELKCRTSVFKSSEFFYLYFKSPVDGYLSIYFDEKNDTVRRLFPYQSQSKVSCVKVSGDLPYYLFDKANSLQNFNVKADRLQLSSGKREEYNDVYVVFSTQPYSKPLLLDAPQNLPKYMNSSQFQEWLFNSKVTINDFNVQKLRITISKE